VGHHPADKGVGGLALGALTPLFVLFFNAVWGVVAAWWLERCRITSDPSPVNV